MLSLPAGGDSQNAGEHLGTENHNSTLAYKFCEWMRNEGFAVCEEGWRVLVHWLSNALSSAQENAILRFGGEGSQPLRAQFRQAQLERLALSPRLADAGKLPLRFRKFDRSISADHVPIGPLRTTFARFARSRSTSSAHSNILYATQTPISTCPIAVSRFRSTRK